MHNTDTEHLTSEKAALQKTIVSQRSHNDTIDNNEDVSRLNNQLPLHWQQTTLGNVGKVSGGGTPSTLVESYWNGSIPWVTPSEATRTNGFFISDTERHITEEGLKKSVAQLLPSGTVMMTSRATIGKVIINSQPTTTNQGFINVICDSTSVHNIFLAYWMCQNKKVFEDRSHGVTFKEITKSSFKTIGISLPPLLEQCAIAHILNTIQQAIHTRRHELELERECKASLMEHLFTHGTCNEPTKHTELGEIPASWQVVRVGEIMDIKYGKAKPIDKGKVPVYGSSGPYSYVNKSLYEATSEQPGLVIGRKGNAGTAWLVSEPFWPSDTVFYCVLKDLSISLAFIFNYLRCYPLLGKGAQTTVPSVQIWEVENKCIPKPQSEEQYTIVFTLHSCDNTIGLLEREIQLLEELFKATLEQLMTGRLSACQ
jgi:type I restriction enzyme S subunit